MFDSFKRLRLSAALFDEEVPKFSAVSATDHRNCGQSSGSSGFEDFDCSESAQELHPLSVDKAQPDQVLLEQWYDFFICSNYFIETIWYILGFNWRSYKLKYIIDELE